MQKWQKILTLFVLMPLQFQLLSPCYGQAQSTEWLFVQKQAFSGVNEIYWTANAIKIVGRNQGYTIVCHAPDWKLFAYRDDDKIYQQGRLPHSHYPGGLVPPSITDTSRVKVQTIHKDGLSITKYRMKSDDGNPQEMSLVELPAVAPQITDLLLTHYRLYAPSGLIYSCHKEVKKNTFRPDAWNGSFITREGEESAYLVTTQIKKLPYKPSDFEYPKGYKLVKGVEIYTSKLRKQDAEVIFKDLDVGSQFGKK